MCENYVEGYRKLPEDREGDGNEGNLPKLIFCIKTLVTTVEPSELQGPPGSSLQWSVAWAKVL